MCLYTKQKEFKTDKDIRVYKAVRIDTRTNEWLGLYGYDKRRFPFDELVENGRKKDVRTLDKKISPDAEVEYFVEGGFFHSCAALALARGYKDDVDFINDAFYGRGGNKDLKGLMLHKDYVKTGVFECTIPKGTVCYVDDRGRFASRKIVVYGKRLY